MEFLNEGEDAFDQFTRRCDIEHYAKRVKDIAIELRTSSKRDESEVLAELRLFTETLQDCVEDWRKHRHPKEHICNMENVSTDMCGCEV